MTSIVVDSLANVQKQWFCSVGHVFPPWSRQFWYMFEPENPKIWSIRTGNLKLGPFSFGMNRGQCGCAFQQGPNQWVWVNVSSSRGSLAGLPVSMHTQSHPCRTMIFFQSGCSHLAGDAYSPQNLVLGISTQERREKCYRRKTSYTIIIGECVLLYELYK